MFIISYSSKYLSCKDSKGVGSSRRDMYGEKIPIPFTYSDDK